MTSTLHNPQCNHQWCVKNCSNAIWMQFTRDICQGGVIHVCIVRSVGGDWKFTVKPQSWRYCWKNIFCLLDLNSWHIHFLRDSDFLRDFLDGHNCWDCTTRDASMQELCYVRGRYHPCLLEEIVWSDLTAVWTWFPAPFSSPFFERVSQKIRETKIGTREGINDR